MKVVILAGGLGTRMREETEFRPKPMVEIGGKPLLWHIMRRYADYGHTDFIVCAGYKREIIEEYFAAGNLVGPSESKWGIEVVDTGLETPTGGRLSKIQHLLDEETFFCTYGDGLAPVDMSTLLNFHTARGATATVTLAHPTTRFGIAKLDSDGFVFGFEEKPVLADLVSIGFFVFEPSIFDLLNKDSVLESETLHSLAVSNRLTGFVHHGFWQPLDTYRELKEMQALWDSGQAPWETKPAQESRPWI